MSRTKREHPDWYPVDNQGRDKKPFYKPDKAFKRARRQQERAKVKDAVRHIDEVEVRHYDGDPEIPVLKRNDQWDWN